MVYDPSINQRPSIKPPRSTTGDIPPLPQLQQPERRIPSKEEVPQSTLSAILGVLNEITERQRSFEKRLEAQTQARQKRPEQRSQIAPSIVFGRNGERLSRRHDDSVSPFDLPPEFIEIINAEGYDLEWKTENVLGMDRINYQAKLMANGWRPVPAKRLPGMFSTEDDDGPVRYDGMILMERPMALTLEARADEDRKARQQVNMKHESWGVNSKNTEIFDPNTPMAKSFTISPRSTIEGTDPSWQPALEIEKESA